MNSNFPLTSRSLSYMQGWNQSDKKAGMDNHAKKMSVMGLNDRSHYLPLYYCYRITHNLNPYLNKYFIK